MISLVVAVGSTILFFAAGIYFGGIAVRLKNKNPQMALRCAGSSGLLFLMGVVMSLISYTQWAALAVSR